MNTNKFNLVTIPDEMLSDIKINDKITNRKFSLKTYQELRKLRNLSDHINSNKSVQFSKKNILDSMKEVNKTNYINQGNQTDCAIEAQQNTYGNSLSNLTKDNFKKEIKIKVKSSDNLKKMINELDLYNKQSVKNLTKTKFIFPQLTK